MATKKTEEAKTTNIEDFKQSIIEVGVKLCDEIMKGQARNNEASLAAITDLYNAIKE